MHARHSTGREFELGCDDCHKRVQVKMEKRFINDMALVGVSEENALSMIREMRKIGDELRKATRKS